MAKEFDVEKWVEERKARWEVICSLGDTDKVRDPQAIMEMSDEEFKAWSNQA